MENETAKLANYQRAYREFKATQGKIGFQINLAAYIIVNAVLIAINFLVAPEFPWCIFPLVGWGIGVTMHYTFGVRFIDKELSKEQAKIERLAKLY